MQKLGGPRRLAGGGRGAGIGPLARAASPRPPRGACRGGLVTTEAMSGAATLRGARGALWGRTGLCWGPTWVLVAAGGRTLARW